MEIVTRERFATSNQDIHNLPHGLTIEEMMAAVGWKDDLRPWTYVTVDGRQVPAEIWSTARPKEGRRVLIALRPAGGGGGGAGKQIAMAVAAIAIMVVAWYVAPIIVGALAGVGTAGAGAVWGGAAVALTQAGIAIAGTLALSALVKPGSIGRQALTNSGSGGNSASESSTYGVNGATNTISRYGVVPRVYGRHRITPPFAAEPYVVSAGTSQTINLLLDFGYGPLLVEDIRIGNTPISNFPTARWFVHSEYKKGDPLQLYLNDQSTLEVNAVLTELVDNVRVSPQAGSVVTLEFQFPGGLTGFTDQGASYQKDDHITVFAMPEDGSGGWQPISNFSPYALFQGEGGTQNSGPAQVGSVGVVRWSRGTTGGYPMGFTTGDPVVQQMTVGSLFTYDGAGYTINAVEPNTLESGQWNVTLANLPPNISWIYTHTGVILGQEGKAGTFPLPGSGVASGPLWVTFGPSPYDVEFHGQTRTPRVVSVVMQMPYENKWKILVRRSTPVSNSSLIANQITWSTVRSSRWVAPIAPEKPRTIMELQITASEQISGQVQNINALCTSILKDPRFPRARVATRNPAWIYADILTGTANPRPVMWSRLDEAKLIEWANKNDKKTVQGDRFATCDLVVDYRLTIGELAQNVCSTGRGAPTVVDGLYSVLLDDDEKVPVQMFTNRNADNFQATRAWVDLPHALKVQYMSEATWNREELIVYADGYNELNATKFESLQLAGIVRPSQVWRFGRYYMAAAFLRREKLSLSTDVENLVCQRGDLVRVAHDRLLQNFVARVREINGAILTLDGYLTPNPGATLHGQLRAADGSMVDSFPIVSFPAEDQVEVDPTIASQASPGDLIAIGTMNTETSDWLVDRITAGGDFSANLDLIEYAPAVLQADKGPIPPYVPNEGSGILTDLPPVRNLTLTSTLFAYTPDGVPTHENLLQWDPPAFQVAFYIVTRVYVVPDPSISPTPPFLSENVLVELGRPQPPRFLDPIDTRTLRQGGTLIRYSVVPVTFSGRRGAPATVEAVFLPDTTPPPQLTFTTNVLSETTMLIWGRPDVPDLGGYQIRFIDTTIGKTNPAWEDMVSVVDSVSPNTTSLTVHIQTGTYAIRAFDTSGNFGPPSYSVTNIEKLPHVDELTRLVAGPTWAGTFDRAEIVNNELRLKPNADGTYPAEGWFYATSAVDYPSSWLFRVRGAFDLQAFPVGTDPRGDWNAQIWVSIQKTAPKLNSAWFSPLNKAKPLAGGPGVYVPLATVSQTDIIGRLVNWAVRLTSRRPTLTPSVKKAVLIVDHSERREFGNDIATGTGGKNITFSRPFFAAPSVAVTLNDGQTGDRIVKSASTTALTVEVFNNAGVSVNRKIDWQAIGYGRGET